MRRTIFVVVQLVDNFGTLAVRWLGLHSVGEGVLLELDVSGSVLLDSLSILSHHLRIFVLVNFSLQLKDHVL